MRRAARVLHLRRTRRVVVIENHELEGDPIGKVRHVFRSAPESGAHVGIDAFQIVEKSRRGDVPLEMRKHGPFGTEPFVSRNSPPS